MRVDSYEANFIRNSDGSFWRYPEYFWWYETPKYYKPLDFTLFVKYSIYINIWNIWNEEKIFTYFT